MRYSVILDNNIHNGEKTINSQEVETYRELIKIKNIFFLVFS